MEMKKYRLGEICSIIPGFAFKAEDFDKGDNIVIKITDIQPPYINIENAHKVNTIPGDKRTLLLKDDFVMAMTGATIGKIGRLNRSVPNVYINQRVCKFIVKDGFSKDFLYYVLIQPVFRKFIFQNVDSSSAQPNIGHPTIYNFEFQYPPYDSQIRIAKVLSSLDSKIALNRHINAKLEQMAKRLYDYWFVQFDFPNAEGKPYKSSSGKMVWNDILKREIPEGWEVKLLGDAISINRGKTITEKKAIKGNVKVVAAGLSFSYYHNQSNRDANCITISGSGENAGFVNFWREPIYASDCSTIQFDNIVDTILCYHTLKMQEKRFYQISHKSAQPHIQPSDIAQIPMVFPDEIVKEKVSILFAHYNTLIGKNQKEIERLTALRDKLLPLLMNGQVTVK